MTAILGRIFDFFKPIHANDERILNFKDPFRCGSLILKS